MSASIAMSSAAIAASSVASYQAAEAQQAAVQSVEKTIPLNQPTDCHNFSTGGHHFYYCEVISPQRFNEMHGGFPLASQF